MSARTQELIDTLAADLAPVSPVSRIRTALAGALVLWSLVLVGAARMHDPPVDLTARLGADGVWAGIVLGLALASLAGAMAGLAGAVPGRERLEQRARWVALGGLALAVIVGLYASLLADGGATIAPLTQDAKCFAMGASIGLAPGLALLAFARRGFALQPGRDAALLVVGSFALGGLAVHVICHHEGARHMLLGHAMIPVLLLGLVAAPLAAWLSHRRRTADGPTC